MLDRGHTILVQPSLSGNCTKLISGDHSVGYQRLECHRVWMGGTQPNPKHKVHFAATHNTHGTVCLLLHSFLVFDFQISTVRLSQTMECLLLHELFVEGLQE